MIQPIQIFGWIILVIIPIIFFAAIKPEKTAQFKDAKRIACFVLMGIFALGIIGLFISLFLHLAGLWVWWWWPVHQFLSLWGFRPTATVILYPLLRGLPHGGVRIITFMSLNLVFSAGMIFFYFTKSKTVTEVTEKW